jgi:hypothetical protein
MRHTVFATMVLCMLTAGACSDDMPTTPTASLTVDGTWQTDVTVEGQSARMVWVLTQTGTSASGPVTLSLPSGIVLMNGLLTGTVSNATATGATLAYAISVNAGGIPSQASCSGQFGGTMSATAGAPTKMTGDFAVKSSTCASPFTNATLTMTKQ